MARGGDGDGEATRARHSMAVSCRGWPSVLAAPPAGRGWVKVPEVAPPRTASRPIERLFSRALHFPVGGPETGRAGGLRKARRAAGAFARPNAALPRLHGLASLTWLHLSAGFAIIRRG